MTDTFAALTAAGVRYRRDDFADPRLDGPTALTVTADGRVFGHLATWGTPHIGMGSRVTPPKSPSGYKFFHQGVVATQDGDLPVGKLTLGTGHAPVDGHTDAIAAASHYDNTGMVAAVVRAGEDRHGIWLAGRMVPGVSDQKTDELRRSGVSGDWRGINGTYELVAALAVNTPGFPIPRTEELVASGVAALVAAGMVVPPGATMPQNREQFDAVMAQAVRERVDAELPALVAAAVAEHESARTRRARAASVVASARRDRLAGIVAAARRVRSPEGARRWGVSVGDLIPDAKTIGTAVGNDVGKAAEEVAQALGAKSAPEVVDVEEAEVEGAPAEVEAPKETEQGSEDPEAGEVTPPDPAADPETVAEDAAEEAAEEVFEATVPEPVETDVPPRIDGEPGDRLEEDQAPETGAQGGALVDFADGVAVYDDGTQTDGTVWTRTGDGVTASLWGRVIARRGL